MNNDRRNQTPSGIPGARLRPPPLPHPDPVAPPVVPEDQWINEGGSLPPKSPSKTPTKK